MNNLLSYCGLVDVRINASDKDLPVSQFTFMCFKNYLGLGYKNLNLTIHKRVLN